MSEHNGTYPQLTVELDPNSVSQIGTSSSGGSISAIVSGALRQVLGWRPNANDPKGFVDSLNQSFQQSDEDGNNQWTWRPHSYTVYTDGSALTGAQASVYDRAKNARDKALPLLDALMPLRTDSDDEDVDATRAIIESDLTELVNEIGRIGGPRVQRIDIYFANLIGSEFIEAQEEDPLNIGGNLEKLRERLGLAVQEVNTIEEEDNYTNFVILTDYIVSLQQSWRTQKRFFNRRGTDVFLGTQLVWINRSLANLGESIQEARFIFDSVFINDSERETIQLPLPTVNLNGTADDNRNGTGQSFITLAELLDWIENFVMLEAPRLIRDGGKDGVIALQAQMSTLLDLLQETLNLANQDSSNPAPGFHTPRARRALEELVTNATALDARINEIERITAPKIENVKIKMNSGGQDDGSTNIDMTVIGTGFGNGSEVYLIDKAAGDRTRCLVIRVRPQKIECVPLMGSVETKAASTAKSLYVLVFNPDGKRAEFELSKKNFSNE